MAASIVCFEISASGKLLSRACVGEGDQFEAALAKPIGDRDPTLSVTVFAVPSRDRNRNISWETDQLVVGMKSLSESTTKKQTEPYIKSVEDLDRKGSAPLSAHSVKRGIGK